MEESSSDSDHQSGDSWLNEDQIDEKEVDSGILGNDENVGQNSGEEQIDVPKVGMIFISHDEIYDFYNQYARKIGFSIRKGQIKRLKSGKIRKRVILCSKQGFREKHNRGTPEKARPLTRTGCSALIQCVEQGDTWVITKFAEEHNHKLAKASESHLLRSQRKISCQQSRYMDSLHSAGCGPTQSYRILGAEHGGTQHLTFTQKDWDNHYQKRRREIYKEGDAQVALNYFTRMQKENPSFFYSILVDQNNQTCNMFWADAKSRIDYEFFGDVVCFDTTFRTNRYNMPCAPFVGVNHHGMSVLFGCALLLDESTESFVWAFESFLNVMSGKHPKTILTDQAQAISNALEKVMPNTHHRLCLWHIYQNAAKHLSHVYATNKQFKKSFKSCIYNPEIEEEFESDWVSMLNRYSLLENKWLKGLYMIRYKWAPVYGRDYFCAGMTTTQRSESVNSFVKGYVKGTLRINDFITQYEKAVLDWREKENRADYDSTQTDPVLISALPFEKQASELYTRKVFNIIQKRLKKFACFLDQVESDESNTTFIHRLEMVIPVKHDKDRQVFFSSIDNKVKCSCKSFEFTGMLCVHALRVLLSRRILEIPSEYILNRWTKYAKDGFTNDDISICANFHESSNLRYNDLAHKALTIAMKGATDHGSTSLVKRHLTACLKELNVYQMTTKRKITEVEDIGSRENKESNRQCHINDQITIRDPPSKRKKGEQSRRYKPVLEKCSKKKKVQKPTKAGKKKELACSSNEREKEPLTSFVPTIDVIPDALATANESEDSFERLMSSINVPQNMNGCDFEECDQLEENENSPTVNTTFKDELYSRLSCTELLHGFLPNNGEPTLISDKNILISDATTNDLVECSSSTSDSSDSGLNNLVKDLVKAPVKWSGTVLNVLNPLIQDNIENWEDVKGDGHCGYRAIAEQLGLSAEDGWKEVKRSMLAEMKAYEDVYKPVFGEEDFKYFESGLKCEDVIAPKDAWIKFPFMGNIVASAFDCVYIVLHSKESITYLPWREMPDSLHNRIIAVCNVQDGTHYVKVKLTENAPFPPISFCWEHLVKNPEIKIWAHVYKKKFDEWQATHHPGSEIRRSKFKKINSLFPIRINL